MKKSIIVLIGIVAVAGFMNTACNNAATQQNLAKIDSLKTMLVHTQKVFQQADSSKIAGYKSNMEKQINLFRASTGDSIAKETGRKFLDYFRLNDVFTSFLKEYPTLKKDIEYSFNQIDDLKKDVRDGNIDQKKFGEYFAKEQSAIVELSSTVDKNLNSILTATKMYDVRGKEIKILLDSLQKTHASAQ